MAVLEIFHVVKNGHSEIEVFLETILCPEQFF